MPYALRLFLIPSTFNYVPYINVQLGTSEADLLRCYPTLRAEDLANAWAYYRSHKQEIDLQIRENEAA